MEKRISVIIPNFNKSYVIDKCLKAALASHYKNFEIIVVDDCSSDNSVDLIRQFSCKLIELDKRSGASRARNVGAENSTGEILFFIDSDCLLQENTLAAVNKAMADCADHTDDSIIVGGTYTPAPFDNIFFSIFQSVFINYFETKRKQPDYIATHAMAISARRFKESGGFKEQFLPMLEDVEFSHRLRRDGCKLIMNPKILVQHVFNFSFLKSLCNAFNKSKYWTIYSLNNKDLFADSGTASAELKANGVAYALSIVTIAASLALSKPALSWLILPIFIANLFINRGLISAFCNTKGLHFAMPATIYYTTLYAMAVWAGAIAGAAKYLLSYRTYRHLSPYRMQGDRG